MYTSSFAWLFCYRLYYNQQIQKGNFTHMEQESCVSNLKNILNQQNLLPDSLPILLSILDQSLPVTTAHLRSIHNISQRQILYCIHRDIDRILELFKLKLICKSKVGIFVDGDAAVKRRLRTYLQEFNEITHREKPHERQNHILALLLRNERSLSLNSLISIFRLSTNTLLKDIQRVKTFSEIQQIRICWNRKNNYHPIGTEIDIRETYISCIFSIFPTFFLAEICNQSYSNFQGDSNFLFGDGVNHLFSMNLKTYWDTLVRCSRKYKLDLSEHSLVEMSLYLDITMNANSNNNFVDKCPEILIDDKNEQDLFEKIAKDIAFSVNLSLRSPFSQNEIEWLARKVERVVSLDTTLNMAQLGNKKNELIELTVSISNDIASFAAKYLHPQMHVDEILIQGLINSIGNYLHNRNHKQLSNHHQHSEIRNLYPYIYRVSSICRNRINEYYKLPLPEELTMEICKHLIAALDRVSTSKSLVKDVVLISNDETDAILFEARLQREYPQFLIRKIIRRENLSRSDHVLLSADLILTNVKIPFLGTRATVVSPLVTEVDKRVINRSLFPAMRELVEPSQGFGKLPSLAEVLTPDNIQLIDTVHNWRAAVFESTSMLIKKDMVEPNYRNAIIDGIERYGSYMVTWPGVALLHARTSDGAKKLAVSITIINQGVNFGNALNDPVRICIALSTIDNISHLRILQELNYIFSDNQNVLKQFINTPIHKIMAMIRDNCRNFYFIGGSVKGL